MRPFPKNKRKQIKAFFLDTIKRTKFFNQKSLKEERTGEQQVFGRLSTIYLSKIGGRKVFVKNDPYERAQRENLSRILAQHNRLVKNGDLKIKYYDLAPNPYIYADKRVGITQAMGNISLQGLNSFLSMSKQNQEQFRVHAPKLHKHITEFLKTHSNLNKEIIYNTLIELDTNLSAIKNSRQDISTDNYGQNARIIGYNSKTKRFKLALIDQIYPGEEANLAYQYKQKK
ncbi:MAG: hypothetical protein WC915_00015 [archaeon]|jgi:hypothetical protein